MHGRKWAPPRAPKGHGGQEVLGFDVCHCWALSSDMIFHPAKLISNFLFLESIRLTNPEGQLCAWPQIRPLLKPGLWLKHLLFIFGSENRFILKKNRSKIKEIRGALDNLLHIGKWQRKNEGGGTNAIAVHVHRPSAQLTAAL